MPPTVSLVLTVHNRPPEVSAAVADSFLLKGNRPDEAVIVLDRPTAEARAGAYAAWKRVPFPVKFIEIEGPPRWICPARAWNRAYEAATCDCLYAISSEVVQDPGNVERARELADPGLVIFGACHNSVQSQLVVGAEPGLLVSSACPRPLGFIALMSRVLVAGIGGADEAFMEGLWYEDDDFYYRLWQAGLDFLWDDRIHGTHLDHARPLLETQAGQLRITRNARVMARKHGRLHVWQGLAARAEAGIGWRRWLHVRPPTPRLE